MNPVLLPRVQSSSSFLARKESIRPISNRVAFIFDCREVRKIGGQETIGKPANAFRVSLPEIDRALSSTKVALG